MRVAAVPRRLFDGVHMGYTPHGCRQRGLHDPPPSALDANCFPSRLSQRPRASPCRPPPRITRSAHQHMVGRIACPTSYIPNAVGAICRAGAVHAITRRRTALAWLASDHPPRSRGAGASVGATRKHSSAPASRPPPAIRPVLRKQPHLNALKGNKNANHIRAPHEYGIPARRCCGIVSG